MKKNVVALKVAFWISVLMLAFSNCAPAENGLNVPEPLSLGDVNSDVGQVAIRVNAADPLVIFKGDIGMNVGGLCDVGNYPANRITWTMREASGANAFSSTANIVCDGIRFRFLVEFPQGFNYDTSHTLDITLAVSEVDGSTDAQPIVTSIGVLPIEQP